MGTRPGFGKAEVGFKSRAIGKPKVGEENRIRIIPPMGNLANDPFGWRVFHKTIWGFQGVHPKEPGKTVARPIKSIEVKNIQSGMVTQEDPLIKWIEDHKAITDAMEAEAVSKHGKDEAKKVLAENEEYLKRRDWEKRFNVEGKVYINVMYPDSTFGAYKINSRDHKKQIEDLYKKLKEKKNIDAFDLDEGVWFTINHTGSIAPDVVDIYKEEKQVKLADGSTMTVEDIVLAPLTEEQSTQALNDLPDLTSLGGDVLTYDQMVALRDCSGDPREVDAIFGGSVAQKNNPQPATSDTSNALKASRPATETPKAEAPSADDPAIKARLEAIRARKAKEAEEAAAKLAAELAKKNAEEAEKKKLAEQTAVATSPASAIADDEEFLKRFGG